MKSTRVEIILLIVVLFVAVAANEAPIVYADKGTYGFRYPPIYPKSFGPYDGWVLESGENTNIGGTVNNVSPIVNVGDDALRKQYRVILHFNTAAYHIPPAAVIRQAVIRMRLQGITGGNPFPTFGSLYVDMKKPYFGTAPLVITDFQALAGRSTVARFVPVGGSIYKAVLNYTGKAYLNKNGSTQFRVYFKLGDDNDKIADYMRFYSGNAATAALRPTLEIVYCVYCTP